MNLILRRALNLVPVNGKTFGAFPRSFSSAVSPTQKGKIFSVSYLVNSLGLTRKVAESISIKVSSLGKAGNPDSVLSLLKGYGFTEPQISSIVSSYPRLFMLDAEKSLGPKLQFLQSRGASTSELTEIISEVPMILGMRWHKAISRHYDFVRDMIEADKSSTGNKKSSSLPHVDNKFRNVSALRELGVPQKHLFSLLIEDKSICSGKEKFDKSLKKVVEMGFDPTTPKFVTALRVVYESSDKAVEDKVNLYKSLGLAERDVWAMFKKWPKFLTYSEQNIMSSTETFLAMGFSRDEFEMMVKRFPLCLAYSAVELKKKTEFLVKNMHWPLKALVSNPQVLGYSMNTRIVPRCNVIKALLSKGLLMKSELPEMSYVFMATDQVFLKRNVEKHDCKDLVIELKAIFNTRDTSDPNLVLSLLRRHGFTDSQISSILKIYPELLRLDAERSLAPKLKFLQSRAASSSDLTEIVAEVPNILRLKGDITVSRYYDFVKDTIAEYKGSGNSSPSLPQGKQGNMMRNLRKLKESGVSKKSVFSLLTAANKIVSGKDRFEESLKLVTDMDFDPKSPKFIEALKVVYSMSCKTREDKFNLYKRLGFAVEDVRVMFKKFPRILALSEKNIVNSIEVFIDLGFSRDELTIMLKRCPLCIAYSTETVKKKAEFLVKRMNWNLAELVQHPEIFTYSMEKRIVPRCNVIKALLSKGLIESELPSVISVLYCTNQTFIKRYVRKHDDNKELVAELMAIFTSTTSAS